MSYGYTGSHLSSLLAGLLRLYRKSYLDSTLLGILDEWYLGLNCHVSLVVSLNYLGLF
jgi:predicted membrane protein